jgi:hypothetical protein
MYNIKSSVRTSKPDRNWIMAATKKKARKPLAAAVVFASLPGPTRKREPSPYCYRLTHHLPEPAGTGCVLLWDVMGGRDIYQVSLERQESGALRYHCTCPDAVYRGETGPHVCKHVRGVLALGRPTAQAPVPTP